MKRSKMIYELQNFLTKQDLTQIGKTNTEYELALDILNFLESKGMLPPISDLVIYEHGHVIEHEWDIETADCYLDKSGPVS